MTSLQKLFSLWNRIVSRESQTFNRSDITIGSELIRELRLEALRQKEQREKGTELKAATKFLNNTLFQQMVAIGREYQEVHYAYLDLHDSWDKPLSKDENACVKALAEELVDLQTVCQTMLVMLGVDIDQVRHDVIEKNARRGYYDRS
ncbi:hypothetical protein [Anaeroselena agilis]|uniref:Uncharacterized protein n=1 Tax=Anaeroselena agilis TaxID=3063788 RepID=A0ABU3NTA4_9FIRM|nr:hypothetical protein [Selenomonadales bacterium 4137-cl]